MDPCWFIRLTVGNLAIKTPVRTKPPRTLIHPTTTSPCYARIKLNGFPTQTTTIPYISPELEPIPESLGATFHLTKHDLLRLSKKTIFSNKLNLSVEIRTGGGSCGVRNGRLLGRVCVPLDFGGVDESRAVIYCHNGWTGVGKERKEDGGGGGLVHLYVRVESDPRFVFEFDGEPECSPQVFQLHGSLKQPVFTCNFSCRPNGPNDRLLRPRSLQSEQGSGRGWLSTFGSERERQGKERKGWSITVHDLSGSPVAAASMVTPFVASPGSDRVSRSNPGSWLILRPGEGTWKPWGRLEAWRERGPSDGLGYRFELIPDIGGSNGVVLAESTLSTCKGGKFTIDLGLGLGSGLSKSANRVGSPGCSPRFGSGDFKFGLWPYGACKGFVMSARVEGEGKCSKPTVEVGVQHVTCTEDAAAYVALAAAIDLSMDACRLFSHKLRKELCQPNEMS